MMSEFLLWWSEPILVIVQSPKVTHLLFVDDSLKNDFNGLIDKLTQSRSSLSQQYDNILVDSFS